MRENYLDQRLINTAEAAVAKWEEEKGAGEGERGEEVEVLSRQRRDTSVWFGISLDHTFLVIFQISHILLFQYVTSVTTDQYNISQI